MTTTLKEALGTKVTAEGLRKIAEGEGFKSMSMDGITKALQGMTTIEELFRVAPPEIYEPPVEKVIQPAFQEEVVYEESVPEEHVSSLSMSRPPNILLADDNEIILKVVSNILESEGYRIDKAKNGMEALRLALREKPDLIITDFLMPVMDGVTLIKRLKSQLATRYIPIIMLTAKDEEDAEVEVIDAGADDYLTKPVNAQKLLVRIKRLLNRPVIE